MSDKPVFSSAVSMDPTAGIVSTNKVLSNTYWLLGLTLAFSALTATLSVLMNLPQWMALVLMLVGFGLLFVVHKMADSAKGLPAIFAFTGVWGASIGPMLSFYLAMENGPTMVLQALGGTALIFFSLSAYALNTKKDFSYLGGFLMTGLIVAVVAMIANIFLAIPALSITISAVVIMIMAGLILFDTSRIIQGGETNYIRATVGLYTAVDEGHTVRQVFFHSAGVSSAVHRDARPGWNKLAERTGAEFLLCSQAVEEHGIVIEPPFVVGGLGALVEAAVKADKVLSFV